MLEIWPIVMNVICGTLKYCVENNLVNPERKTLEGKKLKEYLQE